MFTYSLSHTLYYIITSSHRTPYPTLIIYIHIRTYSKRDQLDMKKQELDVRKKRLDARKKKLRSVANKKGNNTKKNTANTTSRDSTNSTNNANASTPVVSGGVVGEEEGESFELDLDICAETEAIANHLDVLKKYVY